MVDWSLARQLARLAAGTDRGREPGFDVAACCAEMEPHVAGYTGLVLGSDAPAPELVARADWASANLDSMSRILDPVAARLDDRLAFAGPLAGALRAGAGATVAAEVGLVVGYMSQRVLGQYDVSLLGGEAPPRLLFVAPNLGKAIAELDVDAEAFGRWICAHELTHVYQFQGVPWLRDHLSGLLRAYLATVDVRIERGSAGGLPSLPDPAKLIEAFRDGGLVALVQSREQRAMLNEIQAAMATIEGYSEHVMDALGPTTIPNHEPLRAAMTRRRESRSAPERLLQKLLGFDLKLRQYELGKKFCDEIAATGGIDRLNAVWNAPETLPTTEELASPASWLERTTGHTKAA